jgi:putative two-component system response regulator
VAVVLLAAVAHAVVHVTGGSPNALNHTGYLAVILAAYLFGWRGGLVAGLLVGTVLGPLGSLTGMRVEAPEAWAVRGTAFVGVGLVTGTLFDRMRHARERWQATAIAVEQRERDGMLALARGAEAKDTDTGEHIRRVQLTSTRLARESGLDHEAAGRVGWSAMLHDVGKLHVPDRILLKPGPLDAAEWEIMRRHPIWGEEILAVGDGFELARRIARWHHEDFDGRGYPDRLAGDRIPLEARIVRITDAFDAMTNRRPYTAPRSFEEALEELDRCAGRQFDPDLVRLMVDLVRGDDDMRRKLTDLRVDAGHFQ